GRWWGIDPFTRERHSISIVASNHSGSMLFGACKWSAEKMDLAELNDLKAQSELFSCSESYYYLFSRAGFTKTCQDLANKDERIILVSFSK
ncbi:MAG: ATP-binding protein, partial [Clostridiales bacterium]|nr:ATP-binding protein [Candidatus Blautia equi]